MATKGKKKGSNTHPAEYTNEDIKRDMQLIAESISNSNQAINALVASNKAAEKRIEAVEDLAGDGEPFGPEDKAKSLSHLAKQVFSPNEDMLIQSGMTEIPNRMVMPIAVERTMNEFIKITAKNPKSNVLLSDLFMKNYAIVMRALRRQLIQEAMGFSQIEMEKQIEEGDRLESRGEG